MSERFVGAIVVVEALPGVEGCLELPTVAPARPPRQELDAKGAMEAFLLALRLWMVRPAMEDGDALPDQPRGQSGVRVSLVAAPRRAVVHQHTFRQPTALEGSRQLLAHRLRALVLAGGQAQVEAGVIVQHRERMAALALGPHRPLEVHLPEHIRLGRFKTLQFP